MTLSVALDADEEWDSSTDWQALSLAAASAAVRESAYPQLLASPRLAELSVLLTDDEAVRALNAEWRGMDRPTNVLSFPGAEPADLEYAGDGPELLLGDIVLARETCTREAHEKDLALPDHAAHLIVHGTLHCLGYDHGEEAEAEDMEAREIRALARLGLANPYAAAL